MNLTCNVNIAKTAKRNEDRHCRKCTCDFTELPQETRDPLDLHQPGPKKSVVRDDKTLTDVKTDMKSF